MSQYASGNVPGPGTTVSGTNMVAYFNELLAAIHSGHYGTTKPADAARGLLWSKSVGGVDELRYEDGSGAGVLLGKVDPASQVFSGGVPLGGIIMWSGAVGAVPYGYQLCDGTNGTPDLRDRFVLGAGGAYNPGDTGGEAAHVLSHAEMPSHSHGVGSLSVANRQIRGTVSMGGNGNSSGISTTGVFSGTGGTGTAASFGSGTVSNAFQIVADHDHNLSGFVTTEGAGAAHNNMPPYYALAFIQRVI